EKPTLPRLARDTRRLFILVPGALGYSWEWNAAVRALEAAKGAHVEFVVFWWEPFGTIAGAADDLARWTNDLLGSNDLPALERVGIGAHSMAGLVAAFAAPRLVPLPHTRTVISTIGTPFAGMMGPDFFYPDSKHSIALFAPFAPWTRYPVVPGDVDFV